MRKAVFLDRDGTINVDRDYLYKAEDFRYIEGAVDGMRTLCQMGYLLVIITNQSGIARGYYSEEEYRTLEKWMLEDLKSKNIDVAGIYYCPHHPEATVTQYRTVCQCRKPGTELFWRAQRDLDIDMDHSFAIGDKERDLSICEESGVKGILFDSNGTGKQKHSSGHFSVCDNWSEILQVITD